MFHSSTHVLMPRAALLVTVLLLLGCSSSPPDCAPGSQAPCYTGKAGTAGVGLCQRGVRTCSSEGTWGACEQEVLPAKESCDGVDNNCDGKVDETCECRPGQVQTCFEGSKDEKSRGRCKSGVQTCSNGKWGACEGQVLPKEERCNGEDDDCDGVVDEKLKRECFDGDRSFVGKGACKKGTQSCSAGRWEACIGQEVPSREVCNGRDDDCDGKVDNDLVAPLCAAQKGLCRGSRQICSGARGWIKCDTGALKNWSQRYVKVEGKSHCDGIDNDCDGTIDEGCACKPGAQQECFGGKPEQKGKGRCKAGVQFCQQGVWSRCLEQTLPTVESCNGQDDDCDGKADNLVDLGKACTDSTRLGPCAKGVVSCGPSGKVCKPAVQPVAETCNNKDDNCDGKVDNLSNLGSACKDTTRKGPCAAGVVACGTSATICKATVKPTQESCNGVDDDCDGVVDEGCSCRNGAQRTCYSGNPSEKGKGPCKEGLQFCQNGTWSRCLGEILPRKEACNKIDDDCDGAVDEGCPYKHVFQGGYQFYQKLKYTMDKNGNRYLMGRYAGTVTLGGKTLTSSALSSLFVLKQDPSGKTLWATQFPIGSTKQVVQLTGRYNYYGVLVVNDKGEVGFSSTYWKNIQMGGKTFTSEDEAYSAHFFARLDSNGKLLWAFDLGLIANDYVHERRGLHMALDGDHTWVASNFNKDLTIDSAKFKKPTSPCTYCSYFLVKVDRQGKVLHSTALLENTNAAVKGMYVNAKSELILSGWAHSGYKFTAYNNLTIPPGHSYFLKLDAKGKLLASRAAKFWYVQMVQNPDGSPLLMGWIWNGTNTIQKQTVKNSVYIIKLKSDFSDEWLYFTPFFEYVRFGLVSLAVAPNGNIGFVGYYYGSSNITFGTQVYKTTGTRVTFVAALNSQGKFLFAKATGTGGRGFHETHSSSAYATNQGLSFSFLFHEQITLGNHTIPIESGRMLGVAAIDWSGNWQKPSLLGWRYLPSVTANTTKENGQISLTVQSKGRFSLGKHILQSTALKSFVADVDSEGNIQPPKPLVGWMGANIQLGTDRIVEYLFTGTQKVGNKTFTSLSPQYYDYLLVRMSSSGVIKWSRQFANTGRNVNIWPLHSKTGESVLAFTIYGSFRDGSTTIQSNGNSDILLLKIDANGKTLWSRKQNGADSDQLRGMALLADGSIGILTRYKGNSVWDKTSLPNKGTGNATWVANINSKGSILTSSTIQNGNNVTASYFQWNEKSKSLSMQLSVRGDLQFQGKLLKGSPTATTRFFVSLDSAMKLQWFLPLGQSYLRENITAESSNTTLSIFLRGAIAFNGKSWTAKTQYRDYLFVQIDTAGKVVWSYIIRNTWYARIRATAEYIYVSAPWNGVLEYGQSQRTASSQGDVYLMKINRKTGLLKQATFLPDTTIGNLILDSEGSPVLSGHTYGGFFLVDEFLPNYRSQRPFFAKFKP